MASQKSSLGQSKANVEVKAAATVRAEDFRGLRYLADRLKDRFFAGYLLYSGPHTLPFGPKFRAMPISALWSARH